MQEQYIRSHTRGYAAITVTLLTLVVSLTIIGGFTFLALREVNVNRGFVRSIESRYVSEGGVEDALLRIVTGKAISSGEELAVGKGTTTIILTIAGQNRTVRSEGKREQYQQNLEAQVTVSTAQTQFFFGAQVGEGGLEMSQNSTVEGSVFSNGNIVGANGAAITGDALAAGVSSIKIVSVGGNAQANLIDDTAVTGHASSTTKLDDVTVGKSAHANELDDTTVTHEAYYNSKDAQSTILGLNCDYPTPGAGCPTPYDPVPANLAPLPLPIPDSTITSWKDDASSQGTIASGTCSDTWSPPTDPYTTNGGVIQTNLLLDNNQVFIMKGTVWVQCNVTIDNGATVKLDPSYGALSGVLLSDGWMHLRNNGQFQGSGTPGSYLMLLTTATGGGHHGSAIDLHNNATGAIFYAGNGMVYLHNNVTVTELVAYKVHLENGATLAYEQGLQNVQFSSGPAGGYDVKYWKEVE